MKLSRLSMLDVAALLGSASPESVAKAEADEGFNTVALELQEAAEAILSAEQRLERAERAMAAMARGFFSKKEIKAAKWEK